MVLPVSRSFAGAFFACSADTPSSRAVFLRYPPGFRRWPATSLSLCSAWRCPAILASPRTALRREPACALRALRAQWHRWPPHRGRLRSNPLPWRPLRVGDARSSAMHRGPSSGRVEQQPRRRHIRAAVPPNHRSSPRRRANAHKQNPSHTSCVERRI